MTEGSRSRGSELFVDVAPDYLDVPLSTGGSVRVYQVPETIIQSIKPPNSKPKRPTVIMHTKAGDQHRPAKSGDAEYDSWIVEVEEWEQEYDDLKEAVTMVLALKDVEYPEDADYEDMLPDDVVQLIELGLTEIPDDPLQRDAFYLRATLMRTMIDEMQINLALQRLSGVPRETIDQIKANFRNSLLGPEPPRVGAIPEDTNGQESE